MKQDLLKLLEPYGQEHLLKYWDDLSAEQQTQLAEEIRSYDFAELAQHFERVRPALEAAAGEKKAIDSAMQPVPGELQGSFAKSTDEQLKFFESKGLKAIADNQVGVLLMAGGQGTRLGVNYPKGMYSVGLESEKTLYQLQAERLVRLKQLADEKEGREKTGRSIVWYIMTSEHTQQSTIDYFKSHDYFGLNGEDVVFFEQFMLPCFTKQGKIILDEKHKLAKAPDGNGGLYRALHKRAMLDDMEKRNVKYLHIYCVDNILVKMADPVFVGFCLDKEANCAAKVVKKVDPDEKVGVICKVNDRFQVVEYSEISQETRNLKTGEDLTYNAGSICNHFITTEFLNDLCRYHEKELIHHVAEKKIPFVNDQGLREKPTAVNGIKLEKFVFDVFPFSTNFAIWEVLREDEFSPLKNADGAPKETPATCREDLYSRHSRWLVKAGATFQPTENTIEPVQDEDKKKKNTVCDVSPLVSYDGEGLGQLVQGKILKKPLSIQLNDEKEPVLDQQ
jgi:UDP-N-acetylglucosamine/UDP-N-acetylgalactosamine diphosphorylase